MRTGFKTTRYHQSGLSLIEVMVAISVLSIAVFGTASYRYYSTLDTQRAEMRLAATRLGLLFCESWRGDSGDVNYDPVTHLGGNLSITAMAGPSQPGGYTLIGGYRVVLNDRNYYVTLAYNDINSDMRALHVIVSWAQENRNDSVLADSDKSIQLTSYTLI